MKSPIETCNECVPKCDAWRRLKSAVIGFGCELGKWKIGMDLSHLTPSTASDHEKHGPISGCCDRADQY